MSHHYVPARDLTKVCAQGAKACSKYKGCIHFFFFRVRDLSSLFFILRLSPFGLFCVSLLTPVAIVFIIFLCNVKFVGKAKAVQLVEKFLYPGHKNLPDHSAGTG